MEDRLGCWSALTVIGIFVAMMWDTNRRMNRPIGPCIVTSYDQGIRGGYSYQGVWIRDKDGDSHFARMGSSSFDLWSKRVGKRYTGSLEDMQGTCQ